MTTEQLRTYYSVYYLDEDGFWKVGAYRKSYGRIKARMVESVYRMSGTKTKLVKETLCRIGSLDSRDTLNRG